MPKQRITKQMVLDAAFQLLREGGGERVLVKSIAAKLSCSVQPIYSYCENMDALRQELSQMAADFMRSYVQERLEPENPFESTGKAYISFAGEEPYLFQNCFLRRRSGIDSLDDFYAAEASDNMQGYLAKTFHISADSAKRFHMNMMIYNTGLSFMMISTGCRFSERELSEKLKGAYGAFLDAAEKEGENDESDCHL